MKRVRSANHFNTHFVVKSTITQISTGTQVFGKENAKAKKIRTRRERYRSVLHAVMNHPISFPFMLPVDSTKHPEYKDVVKTPMSLKQVESNLECGTYDDDDDDEIKFIQDMKLIFSNCKLYNGTDSEIWSWADVLEKETSRLMSLSPPLESVDDVKEMGTSSYLEKMRQENLVLRRWTRNDATPHNIEHRISLLHYLINDLACVDSQREKINNVAMYRYNCLQTYKNALVEINQKSLNESDDEEEEEEEAENNDTNTSLPSSVQRANMYRRAVYRHQSTLVPFQSPGLDGLVVNVLSLGTVSKQSGFHTVREIWPIGFTSSVRIGKTTYTSTISSESNDKVSFQVAYCDKDDREKKTIVTASSANEVWNKVMKCRWKGTHLFGLDHPLVCIAIEGMWNVFDCDKYVFRERRLGCDQDSFYTSQLHPSYLGYLNATHFDQKVSTESLFDPRFVSPTFARTGETAARITRHVRRRGKCAFCGWDREISSSSRMFSVQIHSNMCGFVHSECADSVREVRACS